MVVSGAPGAGKSSLLRAGVLPHVRRVDAAAIRRGLEARPDEFALTAAGSKVNDDLAGVLDPDHALWANPQVRADPEQNAVPVRNAGANAECE